MVTLQLDTSRKSQFFRSRWLMFFSLCLGWSFHILIRKNLPSTMPSLIQNLGFTRSDIGVISSCFAISYGSSKFIGSVISDHASPRRIFSCGLVLVGLGSMLFPFASSMSLTLACAVWIAVGLVQGLGWPPCVILLNSWYPPSHIGRYWSILSGSGNVASALLPLLVIFITSVFGWSTTYLLFGAMGMATGVIVLFTIKDSPEDIGVASFNKSSKKGSKKEVSNSSISSSKRWYSVFLIPNLWIISLIYIIMSLVNSCALNWSQLYLVQESGMSQVTAAACYSLYQVGSTVGNLISGYLSDLFVTTRTSKCMCPRSPLLLVLSLLIAFLLHLFRTTVDTSSSEVWVSVLMFTMGFVINSGVSVIGLCSMEVVPKEMVGSAHGLASAVAQVGSFGAGWPFSHVVETQSWNTAYYVVELFLVAMVILSSYFVFLLVKGMKKIKLL